MFLAANCADRACMGYKPSTRGSTCTSSCIQRLDFDAREQSEPAGFLERNQGWRGEVTGRPAMARTPSAMKR